MLFSEVVKVIKIKRLLIIRSRLNMNRNLRIFLKFRIIKPYIDLPSIYRIAWKAIEISTGSLNNRNDGISVN